MPCKPIKQHYHTGWNLINRMSMKNSSYWTIILMYIMQASLMPTFMMVIFVVPLVNMLGIHIKGLLMDIMTH